MLHQKLPIQVEDWDVPLVLVPPLPVFWETDVHLLKDELDEAQRDGHLINRNPEGK